MNKLIRVVTVRRSGLLAKGDKIFNFLAIQHKETTFMTYSRLLKQIQGLPKRAATAGIYLLLGTLPLEALIVLRVLSLIGAISRSANDTLFALALGQTSVKSWISYCNLPPIIDILDTKPDKSEWKATCKRAVHSHWTLKIKSEAEETRRYF